MAKPPVHTLVNGSFDLVTGEWSLPTYYSQRSPRRASEKALKQNISGIGGVFSSKSGVGGGISEATSMSKWCGHKKLESSP